MSAASGVLSARRTSTPSSRNAPRADSGKRGVVGEAEERHDIRGTGHVFAARGARASERAAAEAARRVA
jgi:hypothetical protein